MSFCKVSTWNEGMCQPKVLVRRIRVCKSEVVLLTDEQVSEAARNHCKENFGIDVKQVMISAALSSESGGKLATATPAANASTSGYEANTTTTRQPSITATSAASGTVGATAGGTTKSSATNNFDKTSWFGLIPLAGIGLLFIWH